MVERFTLEDAGYIAYADMIERLRAGFPDIPTWRLDQIVAAEHDAITGGILRIVPAEVESGAVEMLSREAVIPLAHPEPADQAPSTDEEVA